MPGDIARLTLRMRFTGLSVHRADLNAVCQTILDLNRPENLQMVENTLSCQQNSPAIQGADGSVKFMLAARRMLEPIWSPQRISREIVGQPVETAQQKIRAMLDLQEDPSIVLFPTWWTRLPFFPFRIQVSRP